MTEREAIELLKTALVCIRNEIGSDGELLWIDASINAHIIAMEALAEIYAWDNLEYPKFSDKDKLPHWHEVLAKVTKSPSI